MSCVTALHDYNEIVVNHQASSIRNCGLAGKQRPTKAVTDTGTRTWSIALVLK
jgi:hypothetical protein